MAKVIRYTKAWEKAVAQAQVECNRTGRTLNVVETVYGVFTGPTSQYPANGQGYYSTIIRPAR